MQLNSEEQAFARRYAEITENPVYLKLIRIPRHGSTNTYNHSIRVAMTASRMAKYMGVDPESAAKVGLLHDFCLINYREKEKKPDDRRWYCFYHPEDAVQNSLRFYELSPKEQKAILSHMFPLATHVPTSRLALILTLADKVVASEEGVAGSVITARKLKRSIQRAFA